MKKERIRTEIKIEGIADQGYGFTYQYVNRMIGLSAEAKTIYNYLSSFAGKSNEAFPSVKLMLKELGMSKTRFYKHREFLLELGLISVKQGRFKYKNSNREYLDTCLYVLLTDYDKISEQKDKYKLEKVKKKLNKNILVNNKYNFKQRQLKKLYLDNVRTIKNIGIHEYPQNEDTQNEYPHFEDINNNNTNNNNINNNNTTTIEFRTKNSSNDGKINLNIKNITKTNIKRLKLNQEQIKLLEKYVSNYKYNDIDKFSYFIAKSIKHKEITKFSLNFFKYKKINSNGDITLFKETKEQQLKSYNDLIKLELENDLIL